LSTAPAAASPSPPPGLARWRLYALAFAALVLVSDQWTKALAVAHLANPVHPLVVRADGASTARALLQARGLSAVEVDAAAARRLLWRLSPAGALRLDAPAREQEGQLIALEGVHMPAPRRLRSDPERRDQTLAEAMAEQWRVSPGEAAALAKQGLWTSDGLWTEPERAPPAGTALALIEREIDVIGGFMRLVYAENPGAAWSFLRDAPVGFRTIFFTVIALLASLAMLWAIWTGQMGTALGTVALGGVLGGALGNVIDRNRYTVVVDFILNYVDVYRWPVWNVADAGITVGVAAILIEALLGARAARAERAAAQRDA
jgi:signal peptidase II